ncbi:hypothetical protein ACHOLT_06930 [Desulfitobacterium sp. Sab5]|uniref:hypothetical protein n=1 Tax=Desulfitobacterium nosdiversum TaxID=3375356 RepID=UPI003CE88DD4
MYKFEMKPSHKAFIITMGGLISREESSNYMEDLSKRLKTFNPSEYYVVIDTQNLSASTQDMLDRMKAGIEVLVKTPFKGRFNIVSKHIITNMQAKRVAGESLSHITPVQSYGEFVSVTQ